MVSNLWHFYSLYRRFQEMLNHNQVSSEACHTMCDQTSRETHCETYRYQRTTFGIWKKNFFFKSLNFFLNYYDFLYQDVL